MPDKTPRWTSGPWEVQSLIDPEAWAIIESKGASSRTLSKKLIAEFPTLRAHPETQANAQLAAAAPELYTALALADSMIECGESHSVKSRARIQAALAKARGGQTDGK